MQQNWWGQRSEILQQAHIATKSSLLNAIPTVTAWILLLYSLQRWDRGGDTPHSATPPAGCRLRFLFCKVMRLGSYLPRACCGRLVLTIHEYLALGCHNYNTVLSAWQYIWVWLEGCHIKITLSYTAWQYICYNETRFLVFSMIWSLLQCLVCQECVSIGGRCVWWWSIHRHLGIRVVFCAKYSVSRMPPSCIFAILSIGNIWFSAKSLQGKLEDKKQDDYEQYNDTNHQHQENHCQIQGFCDEKSHL